jgi:hypothetical protein
MPICLPKNFRDIDVSECRCNHSESFAVDCGNASVMIDGYCPAHSAGGTMIIGGSIYSCGRVRDGQSET